MPNSGIELVDVILAFAGGADGFRTAEDGISVVSTTGQIVASGVTLLSPVRGALIANPAASAITLVKIAVDVQTAQELSLGDALTVVGNGVSVAAAVCMVIPGGQPAAVALGVVGRAMTIGGIGLRTYP